MPRSSFLKYKDITLVLEIFFTFVKNNPKVKGLNIFKHKFLYTVMQMTLLSFSKTEIL